MEDWERVEGTMTVHIRDPREGLGLRWKPERWKPENLGMTMCGLQESPGIRTAWGLKRMWWQGVNCRPCLRNQIEAFRNEGVGRHAQEVLEALGK